MLKRSSSTHARARAAHLVLSSTALWILACTGATVIDTPAQVENRVLQGNIAGACDGLVAPDVEIRKYTAERLARFDYDDTATATTCLCAKLYDPASHAVDLDVAGAIKKTKSDALAKCLAPALDDPAVADRARVATLIAAIGAPAGYDALGKQLTSSTDPGARAAAASGLKTQREHDPELQHAALADADPTVRAAALAALATHPGPDLEGTMVEASKDPEPSVRAAAVPALAAIDTATAVDATCALLRDDPDEGVRGAVVVAWKGTRRPGPVGCMRQRLGVEEPSEAVRAGLLAALGSARSPETNKILCDAIGPYVRMYVKDALPAEDSPLDIVFVQNDYDFDNSYSCVEKALKTSGLTCYGKFHLVGWFDRLGGKMHATRCPGMPADAASGGGGGGASEVSFE
jgi:hypothetical protein